MYINRYVNNKCKTTMSIAQWKSACNNDDAKHFLNYWDDKQEGDVLTIQGKSRTFWKLEQHPGIPRFNF